MFLLFRLQGKSRERKFHFSCELCNESFNSYFNLKQHSIFTHKLSEEQAECKYTWPIGDEYFETSDFNAKPPPKTGTKIEAVRKLGCRAICYLCCQGFGNLKHMKRHCIGVHKVTSEEFDAKYE